MSAILNGLDQVRANILKITLSFELSKKIFVSRALRLFFFYFLSFILNFFFALLIPLWLIALGPLLFGITHLFSSARFLPKALTHSELIQTRITQITLSAILIIGVIRILQLHSIAIPNIFNTFYDSWEWLVLLSTLLCMAILLKPLNASFVVCSSLSLLPLGLCSWHFPIITAAVLLIGHHFVPFFYWFKMTKSLNERKGAVLAGFLFLCAHLAFLFGLTDPIAELFQIHTPNFGPAFNPIFIAQQIFPNSTDFILLKRGLSMFAFGQSMHYFLWIKVIPEISLKQSIPLSFRQSKKSLIKDLGFFYSKLAFTLAIGFLTLPFFFHIDTLREIYIAGVSAHGYVEIAGLPFLFLKRTSCVE